MGINKIEYRIKIGYFNQISVVKNFKRKVSIDLRSLLFLEFLIASAYLVQTVHVKGVPKKMFLFLKLSTEWSCNIIIIVRYLHLGSRSVNYCSEVFKTLTTCGLKLFLVLKRDA